ncbi:MAG: ABC transporter substrate-binding protein [Chloroflexota bacterium]
MSAAASAGAQSSAAGTTVPLVVYSAQGYDKVMVNAFQKATGITTKLVDDSTGPLLAKIQAEKNNPQWGLLWVDGAEAFAALDGQGMLLKGYEPDVAWTKQGASVVPADRSYVPSGLTMAGTLVYDSRTVSNPPTSWQDLLKPEWKGAVGMNNPAISGPTYPFVAGMMQYLGGEQQGKDFFTKLKANGLHVFKTNGDTLHALEGGQIKLAAIQSSAGIGAGLKIRTIKTAFLPKVSLLPSAIGIDAKAPAAEQAEAKKFAAFVLSKAGQQVMLGGDKSGDSLYWPVIAGVSPLGAVPAIGSVAWQAVNPYTWGPKESEINQWFSDNVAQ